jgi:uncharacterized protein YndB with AHSA1/START domain
MPTINVSNEIKAPVDRVFAAFTDIEHGRDNVSNIKNTELLTTGKFSLGTRWREMREVLGHLDEAEMEVTAFERNRTYTISHHKGGARIDAVFTFTPAVDTTKVGIEFQFHNEGGLPPGLLSPLEWAVSGRIRDVLLHDLADLKESVERVAR